VLGREACGRETVGRGEPEQELLKLPLLEQDLLRQELPGQCFGELDATLFTVLCNVIVVEGNANVVVWRARMESRRLFVWYCVFLVPGHGLLGPRSE
jgi:hypothetical protein